MSQRVFVTAAVTFFFLALPRPASSQEEASPAFQDPLALYGSEVRYDILRNGEKVGDHEISFTRHGDTVIAETHADIAVPFLFLTGYRFAYQSTSTWRDGVLAGLTAMTNDDGDTSKVTVSRGDQELIVTGPTGTLDLDPSMLPIEHWSLAFMQKADVINPITGHVNHITTTKLGSAFVPAANGIVRADRYRLGGDIHLETWYDPTGRWLGMRFAGKDGSVIEYRCRDCPSQWAKAQ